MESKINLEQFVEPKITNQFGFIHDHLILLIKNPMD